MSTSSTSSTAFTGASSFSADLQQVISRAVAIATLPITQLQNQQGTLTGQQSELGTLSSNFSSLQNALGNLSSAAASGSFGATSSDTSIATASLGTGALPGSYAITVTSTGSRTNTISANGLTAVADPSSGSISSSSAFTLTVNSQTYQVNPAGSSLNDLVKAINSSGAAVSATVVNVGGSSAPDYRLSIQGTGYSPDSIQLSDGTTDLLNAVNTGSYVTYQVNGQPSTPITSNSRSLTISTGLTVNVQGTGTADIEVTQNSSGVENALSSLVNSFNAATDELAKNRGQGGGALAGDSIVPRLSDVLRSVANYNLSGSGPLNSLADLGVTFDQTGHLQFDTSVFEAAAASSPTAVNALLGTASASGSSTGSGFLQAATDALNSVTDSSTGLISTQNQSLSDSITNLASLISKKQDALNLLQTNLTAQISQADAVISSLEQQAQQITNLFAAQLQASKNLNG